VDTRPPGALPLTGSAGAIARAAVCIVAVAAAAATGVIFQPGGWYELLNKPPGTPPDWLFPVAWTVLYTLMALSAWLAWQAAGTVTALGWFWTQLALNAMWSPVFFGAHLVLAGQVVILALLAAASAAALSMHRVRPVAGWLMTPYLVWVAFAAYLNAGLWLLN